MPRDNQIMPSVLDRQISEKEQDAFGHRHFAEALRSLIESEQHVPPYSVGLLGGWGTGKSTIKELYLSDLQNDDQPGENGLRRRDRIHCITFNAWRFGGKDQDIKRALLRHVYLELAGDKRGVDDSLFHQLSETTQKTKNWPTMIKETSQSLFAFILTILIFCVPITAGLVILFYAPIDNVTWKSIISIAIFSVSPFLLKQVKVNPVNIFYPVTRTIPPSTTAEQYEDLLLEQIRKFKSGNVEGTPKKKCKKCERLVVFVDDLDRLSAEEMVTGLDAVRTFMEMPEDKLPENLGLVFILSCDEDKVAHVLLKRRGVGDTPATVFDQVDARRYLDRIFQFRLEIPPFPRADMRQYAISLLQKLPGITEDLQSQKVPLETLVDRMISVGVSDPRNVIQIINAFAQAWWIAKKREIEENRTEKPGGLHEGAVTRYPECLGALSSIKVNFPEFYNDLQDDPSFLHRITDVVIRKKSLGDQPVHIQQILREKYLERSEEDGDLVEIKRKYRPLRQYLASLGGLRWPESLQKFIYLSEDPFTRKFGDTAPNIYKNLVSGDPDGVLEVLGRHLDKREFNTSEVFLLHDMVGESRKDTHVRRVSAFLAIAELLNRFPQKDVQMVVGPLCAELEEYGDLRSELGINKIKKIIEMANEDDRRAIASRLVEDVLTIDEDVRLKLHTKQSPNLDEAIGFARDTVDIVFKVRSQDGLDTAADEQLLKWLIRRIVQIGGKEFQLPFQEFEQWMNEHQDHLLPNLKEQYTDLLAEQLESNKTFDFNLTAALERAKNVFSQLYEAGEDSRSILFRTLNRYAKLKEPDAVKAAWETMLKYSNSPGADQISSFLSIMVERLEAEDSDEEDHIKLEGSEQALKSLITARLSDLNQTALNSLASIALTWSKNPERSQHSCDIIEEVQRVDWEVLQTVFNDWTERLLDNLPLDCEALYASYFPRLPETTQNNAFTKLRIIVDTDNINVEIAKRYQAFVKNTPIDAWKEGVLNKHLQELLPQIAARFSTYKKFLKKVFPPITRVFQKAPKPLLGKTIHDLFNGAKDHPGHYAYLHADMTGHWFKAEKEHAPYDPNEIFNDSHQFAVSTPNAQSIDLLLKSLRDMISRNIVPIDQRGKIIEAACAIWNAAPERAIETFTSGYDELTPAQTANLIDSLDWSIDTHRDLLEEAWSAVIKRQTDSVLVETTTGLVKKVGNGPSEELDISLRIWFEMLSDKTQKIIADTITRTDINDSERRRLWAQVIKMSDNLNPDFFIETIPILLTFLPIDETANDIFRDKELVTNKMQSQEMRSKLSQEMMKVFHSTPTNTIKSEIAIWCKELSGDAALNSLSVNDLQKEDIDVLESAFGSTSKIKTMRKKIDQE